MIFLTALLVLSLPLSACTKDATAPTKAVLTTQNDTQTSAAAENMRTITDMFERTVTLPEKIDSVAVIGGGGRIVAYAGAADLIVGATEKDKSNVTGMPFTVVHAKTFAKATTVGSGGSNNTTFTEELVALMPDVVIGMESQEMIDDVAQKTGLPVVGITVDNMFDPSFMQALALVGEVTGKETQSTKVINYVQECQSDLAARTKDIPEDQKPTVYAGAVSFKGAHGFEGTYGNYPPFMAIGAKNVVDETKQVGGFLIDIEKVAVWDPDILFLNPGNMDMVNEAYEKNPTFYDSLSAVKAGKIYTQLPYNFNYSNLEIAIADSYYAGKIIFPEQFSDIDPVKKADEIFTVMLGEPFYDKLSADGLRFEAIKIGESR